MALNELIVRKPGNLVVADGKNTLFTKVPTVKYALIDSSRYIFEYKINDDIDVNMFESDRTFDGSEFVDAEFETSVSEKDHSYYTVAVASGVLTGVFSQLKLSEGILKKINEWKDKDWDKYILLAAQMAGYKKSDLKAAKSFLKDRFVPFIDEELRREYQEGLDKWINAISSHPSVAGLVFSAFTQFSGEKYWLGEKGIEKEPVPEYYAIGRNAEEKIVYGLLYWIFNLSIDVALSKIPLLEEMKIPKEVSKLLKELFRQPFFEKIPKDYKDAEQIYSVWIKQIFENSECKDEDGEVQTFDLHKMIDSLSNRAFSESTPVIINECIVRSFYFLKKLIAEVKEKEIKSLNDLKMVDPSHVLPFNNRLISRMILISSGCFVGVNVAGATLKAIAKGKKGKEEFAGALLAEVCIAGVGRFVFACVADSKYWLDDIKVFFQRKDKRRTVDEAKEEEKIAEDMVSNDAFKVLSLNPPETRALYSMEAMVVLKDIEHTEKEGEKLTKEKWLDTWKSRILSGLGIDSLDYFVSDEKAIYSAFCSIEQTEENLRWFYLLTMELVVFEPYYPLGVEEDSVFKKLHLAKYNYIDDQFSRKQTIVSQAEIDAFRTSYEKYKGVVSGKTQNSILAVGVTGAAAALTGGLAFAFAPGIAALIAGEAVVGLHGAALTSASLAFVGGGSLAAGGLGMAGGTAIITGGGALLGIAGSGSASMAAILSRTGSDYWIRQTTKLLTLCKCVLKDRLNDTESIMSLIVEIKNTIKKVEMNIEELEAEDCSLDKELIRNSKDCLKYLNRCKTELEKIIK